MSDEFETLLRDHFRRASERIDPGPELLERARAAGRRRRVRAWSPRLNAVAASVAVGGLVVVAAVLPRSPAGHRTDSVTRPPESVTLQATPAGGRIRLSGTAPGRVEVFLRIGARWANVGAATPADGRYAVTVIAREGTSAARACLAASSVCSVPVRVVLSPSPVPTPTPTRPHGTSPTAPASPPVRPTPTATGSPPETPIPTRTP